MPKKPGKIAFLNPFLEYVRAATLRIRNANVEIRNKYERQQDKRTNRYNSQCFWEYRVLFIRFFFADFEFRTSDLLLKWHHLRC